MSHWIMGREHPKHPALKNSLRQAGRIILALLALLALGGRTQAAPAAADAKPARPTSRPTGPLFYESPLFRVYPDRVERGKVTASVTKDGGIYTNGTFFRSDPGKQLPEKRTWHPHHDLSGFARFSSPYPVVDAAYRLALDNMLACIDAEPKGLINAGNIYGVWVRDTSHVVMQGCNFLFPKESKATLASLAKPDGMIQPEQMYAMFLSSWVPEMSRYYSMSDYIIWIPAAWEYAKATGDFDFIKRYWGTMDRSSAFVEARMFDPADGLYDGGDDLCDAYSGYPYGTIGRLPVKGVNTNIIHYRRLLAMGEMAQLLGKSADRDRYFAKAKRLKDAINREMWMPDYGYYAQLKVDGFGYDRLIEQFSSLGEAFAVLYGIASREQTARIVASPQWDTELGHPLMWPMHGNEAYHDQTIWPMAEGYWTAANGRAGNLERLRKGIAIFVQMAMIEHTFAEQIDPYQLMHQGSRDQAWSCMAYIQILFKGLLGLTAQPDSLVIEPCVPEVFAKGFSLKGLHYREATLDIAVSGSGRYIRRFLLNGQPTVNVIPATARGPQRIVIEMTNAAPCGELKIPETAACTAKGAVEVSLQAETKGTPVLFYRPEIGGQVEQIKMKGKGEDGHFTARIPLASFTPSASPFLYCTVGFERSGKLGQLSPWERVDLRDKVELGFQPGAIKSVHKLNPTDQFSTTLVVKNNTQEAQAPTVRFSSDGACLVKSVQGAELKETSSLAIPTLAPGEVRRIPIVVSPRTAAGYGRYQIGAATGDEGTTQTILPLVVHDRLNLKALRWYLKKTDQPNAQAMDLAEQEDSWKLFIVPSDWNEIPDFKDSKGPVWFRRHMLVPKEWEGYDLELAIGNVQDQDVSYLNGVKIGESAQAGERLYVIPKNLVRFGHDNVLAVKVIGGGGWKGITGWPLELRPRY